MEKKWLLIIIGVTSTLIFLHYSLKDRMFVESSPILPIFARGYDVTVETPHLNLWTNHYGTFAVSVPNVVTVKSIQEWSYVFQSVLTTIAWKEIGFKAIVMLVFDADSLSYHSAKVLKFIVEHLISLDAKVVYLDVRTKLRLRVSQISRLFSSHFVNLNADDFVIVSDVDLWPLNRTLFTPRVNKTIHITNTGIGDIRWGKKIITYYPMSHIGMAAHTWKVMFPIQLLDDQFQKKEAVEDLQGRLKVPFLECSKTRCSYYNFQDLNKLFEELNSMYGKYVYEQTWHGGPLWYLDQWYLSVGIHKYQMKYGRQLFDFVIQPQCRRIDRIKWEFGLNQTKCCWCSSHVLQGKVWGDKQWKRMMLLIEKVFHKDSQQLANQYRMEFDRLYNKTLIVQGYN